MKRESNNRRYPKGADAIQWGVAVIGPVAAAILTLGTTGLQALSIVLLAVTLGILYGATAFFVLPPNAARAVLVLGFLVIGAVLISAQSPLVLGLPTWLLSGIAGSIIGAHVRYLADRKNTGGTVPGGS